MSIMYVEGEAEGAIPNGSRVVKVNAQEGDGSPNGTPGIVVSSISVPPDMREEYNASFVYFIDWGERGIPVFTIENKVEAS